MAGINGKALRMPDGTYGWLVTKETLGQDVGSDVANVSLAFDQMKAAIVTAVAGHSVLDISVAVRTSEVT